MRQDIRFCAARDGVRIACALCRAAAPLVASGTWLSHLEQQWRNLPWRPYNERDLHSPRRDGPAQLIRA